MGIGFCANVKLKGRKRNITDATLQTHHIIACRQVHAQGTKRLSYGAFDGVSGGGALGMSLANDQSQASRVVCGVCRVRQGSQNQEVSARNSPPGKGSGELFGAVQPRRRRKGGARHSVFGLVGNVIPRCQNR